MAKFEKVLNESIDSLSRRITDGILGGSVSASLEESSDFRAGGARCAVRVFERYSAMGSNRVSLTVTMFEADGKTYLSAITSGGSQAMFFKVNTWGEGAFLDKLYKML